MIPINVFVRLSLHCRRPSPQPSPALLPWFISNVPFAIKPGVPHLRQTGWGGAGGCQPRPSVMHGCCCVALWMWYKRKKNPKSSTANNCWLPHKQTHKNTHKHIQRDTQAVNYQWNGTTLFPLSTVRLSLPPFPSLSSLSFPVPLPSPLPLSLSLLSLIAVLAH